MNIIGKGGCAEVFEFEDGKVCKLFYTGQPIEFIKLEYENSVEIYKNFDAVPKPFKIVNVKKRDGIVYERIYGNSLGDLLKDKKDKNEILDIFVNVHKKLLGCHSKNLLSYKEYFKAIISISKNLDSFVNFQETDELKDLLSYKKYISSININTNEEITLIKEIDRLPDGDYICHGDFHLHNVLVKSDNTPIVIDFMNVCGAPFLYDVARTFFILKGESSSLSYKYLYKMGVFEEDILKYINIIKKCRKYEKALNSAVDCKKY